MKLLVNLLSIIIIIENISYSTSSSLENINFFINEWKNRPLGLLEWKPLTNLSKESQFNRDILMIYKTIFPENDHIKQRKIKGTNYTTDKDYDDVLSSFKKLIILQAEHGIFYSNKENYVANHYQDFLPNFKWKYPLASALSHGGRTIFICLDYEIEGNESFLNLVFSKDGKNSDSRTKKLTNRAIESHFIEVNSENKIIEINKDVFEAVKNFNEHKGFNIPMGGFGNMWPNKTKYIGNNGEGVNVERIHIWEEDNHFKIEGQSGHISIMSKHFKNINKGIVMIGIEKEEYGNKGMFSTLARNALSALKNSEKEFSVTGGTKWSNFKDIGDDYPNSLGGRVVYIPNTSNLDLYNKIHAMNEESQKIIFWILLSGNYEDNQYFIKHYIDTNNVQSLIPSNNSNIE